MLVERAQREEGAGEQGGEGGEQGEEAQAEGDGLHTAEGGGAVGGAVVRFGGGEEVGRRFFLLRRALEVRRRGGCHVIPVIVGFDVDLGFRAFGAGVFLALLGLVFPDFREFGHAPRARVGEDGPQHFALVARAQGVGGQVAHDHASPQRCQVIFGAALLDLHPARLPVLLEHLDHELEPRDPSSPAVRVADAAVERPAYHLP